MVFSLEQGLSDAHRIDLPSYDVTQDTPCAMQSPARGLHTIAMRKSGLWTELWTGLWTVDSTY